MPSTPYDAKGLLIAAIDDPNPVVFVEHKLLYKMKGPVPEEMYSVPLSQTKIVREGKHVSVIATSIMVSRALAAAEGPWPKRALRSRSSIRARSTHWTTSPLSKV